MSSIYTYTDGHQNTHVIDCSTIRNVTAGCKTTRVDFKDGTFIFITMYTDKIDWVEMQRDEIFKISQCMKYAESNKLDNKV